MIEQLRLYQIFESNKDGFHAPFPHPAARTAASRSGAGP